MNDTGSNIQTIFPTDLAALQYNQLTYQGHLVVLPIGTANGVVLRRKIAIEGIGGIRSGLELKSNGVSVMMSGSND